MRWTPIAILPFALAAAACESSSGPVQREANAFTFAAAARPGMPVYLRNLRGEIEVEPSPDDTLRVEADIEWRGGPDRPRGLLLSGASMPDHVLICAYFGDGECTKDEYSFSSRRGQRIGDVKVRYRMQVPAGVPLDLLGVDANIRSASAAPVKARTLNGNVVVVTAVGPVRAETMNGNVDVRMTTLGGPDSVLAKTLNGNVMLYLPADVAATVEATSTSGVADTDFVALDSLRRSPKALRGGLRGGGTPVRASTLNGNVSVMQLDAQGRPISN